jgi:hypothetical protein
MEEGRALPLPLAQIVWLERCGLTVDLVSGDPLLVRDEWGDFADRWVSHQMRLGRHPEVERLAGAMMRASGYRMEGDLSRMLAGIVLRRAMEKVCTVQVA